MPPRLLGLVGAIKKEAVLSGKVSGVRGSHPMEEHEDVAMTAITRRAKVRTIVVDDDADIRVLLHLVLGRDERFDIVGEVGDGKEAVALCARLRPDLVVLDRQMPVMGGLQAIPLIHQRSPDTKIVLYTAAGEPDTEEAARAAGAIGVLHKQRPAPDVAGDLVRLLARHLVGPEGSRHPEQPGHGPTGEGRERRQNPKLVSVPSIGTSEGAGG